MPVEQGDVNLHTRKTCDHAVTRWGLPVDHVDEARLIRFDRGEGDGFEAGLALAEICLGGLGEVCRSEGPDFGRGAQHSVRVSIDQPLLACLGCQYAGWPLSAGDFFAMTSGPIRLLRGREPVLLEYGLTQRGRVGVGVLETAASPGPEVVRLVTEQTGLEASGITLCLARTSSLPGAVQIVARSVETAIHQLHTLEFDLRTLVSGTGVAPVPPATDDDYVALGWTNDAVLYGGDVELCFDTDDELLEQIVNQVPSNSSADFGKPFLEIFERYNRDFYQIDPLLFSPARIRMVNVKTGRAFESGTVREDLLRACFERS